MFVSSRGYQVLISARCCRRCKSTSSTARSSASWTRTTPTRTQSSRLGPSGTCFRHPACGAGSYVGVQQMVPPKYSEASAGTRYKVRTRTIRLLEENFDHQIKQ